MSGSEGGGRRPHASCVVASLCVVGAITGSIGLAGGLARASAAPAPPKTSPAHPASGQSSAAAGGGGAPKSPVDITADRQEDFNEERRIVYSGNVESVMGLDRMRTPQLTIFLAKKAEGAAKPAAGPAGSAGSGFGKIERMEAEGTVFVTTPTQNARGDHGTYLALPDTVTLTGNVVLVQDKNVSTGDRLVIDRRTDHATLYSSQASGQGSGQAPGQGRVRGVFYQEQAAPPQPAAAAGKSPGHAPS